LFTHFFFLFSATSLTLHTVRLKNKAALRYNYWR